MRRYGEMFVGALPLRLTVVMLWWWLWRQLLLLRGGGRRLVHGVLARRLVQLASLFLPLLLILIGEQLILQVHGEIWVIVKTRWELLLNLAVFGFITLHKWRHKLVHGCCRYALGG